MDEAKALTPDEALTVLALMLAEADNQGTYKSRAIVMRALLRGNPDVTQVLLGDADA